MQQPNSTNYTAGSISAPPFLYGQQQHQRPPVPASNDQQIQSNVPMQYYNPQQQQQFMPQQFTPTYYPYPMPPGYPMMSPMPYPQQHYAPPLPVSNMRVVSTNATMPPRPRNDMTNGQRPQNSTTFNNRRNKSTPQEVRIYQCAPCEKTFNNERMYQAHCKQHVKCEGCAFTAVKKIVKEHSTVTHPELQGSTADGTSDEPAYKPFIVRMESPEEIQQWIHQRKQKFPTQANIELKKQNKHLLDEQDQVDEDEILNKFRAPNKRLRFDAHGNVVPDNRRLKNGEKQVKKKQPCRNFMKGICKNGDKCRFSHDTPAQSVFVSKTNENTTDAKQEQKLTLDQVPAKFSMDNLKRMMLKNDVNSEMFSMFKVIDFLATVDYLQNNQILEAFIAENDILVEASSDSESEDLTSDISSSSDTGESSDADGSEDGEMEDDKTQDLPVNEEKENNEENVVEEPQDGVHSVKVESEVQDNVEKVQKVIIHSTAADSILDAISDDEDSE